MLVPIGVLGAHAPRRNWGTLKGTPAACWYAPRHTAVGTSSLPWLMKWRSEAGLRSFAVGMSRKLLAEVKPIFSLVAYRRIAEFPDNQTKRADNSYEDRRHKSRCSGREFTITRTKLGNRHQHPPIGVASDWLGEFLHADCARFSSTQSERFYGSRRSAIELPGGVNDSSNHEKVDYSCFSALCSGDGAGFLREPFRR